MHPTDAYIFSTAAFIIFYDLLAKFAMPTGFTISHRVWTWSLSHPWVPWLYLALVIVGFFHFFGIPGTSNGQ